MVIDFITAEATTLIMHSSVSCFIPPPMMFFCYDRYFWIAIGPPQHELVLQYFILWFIPHFASVLLLHDTCFSIPVVTSWPQLEAPLFHSRLSTRIGCCSTGRGSALLDRHCLILIHTRGPEFVYLYIIWCSLITLLTPLVHPALSIRPRCFASGVPLFPSNSSYCLSHPIFIHC